MSWKNLFIVDENGQETVTPVPSETKKPTTSFPTSGPSVQPAAASFTTSNSSFPQNGAAFPVSTPIIQSSGNRFINDIVDLYDKSFTKLNQPGYDFFEFYKMVSKGGIDNPQVYVMALEMAHSMDANVSKDSLVSQSDYYVFELMKVHDAISSDGNAKLIALNKTKSEESATLTGDIEALTGQLQLLNQQLNERKSALSEIDTKYQPKLTETTEKLSANDTARDTIISSINRVKNNIQNNLN